MKEADTAAFGDAAVALALLSGEVSHEVTHTMNFLRLLLEESTSSADAEITRFAKAEFERLQRLVRHLRMLKLPVPKRDYVSLAEVVQHCIEDGQEFVSQRRLSVDVKIPADARVQEDSEGLRAALRNVLLDVLERAPAGSSVTIAATPSAQQPLQLEFSDEGEASPDSDGLVLQWQDALRPSSPLFRRLLAHRLLRHLGWSMSHEHRGQCNVARVTAPLPRSPAR